MKRPRTKTAGKKTGTERAPSEERSKLSTLLKKFEEQLTNQDLRISVADYIRLLQMQRDMDGDKPRDVKVTWVDTDASEK